MVVNSPPPLLLLPSFLLSPLRSGSLLSRLSHRFPSFISFHRSCMAFQSSSFFRLSQRVSALYFSLSFFGISRPPNPSWNRPVLWMYLKSGFKAFGSFSKVRIDLASRSNSYRSGILCRSRAGHIIKKCATVSSSISHAGHNGDSTHLRRWRCLFSGACPIRSCVRMLVCLRGRSRVIFW